ncbi:hypothetical protein AB0C96_36060 [Streptomyces sp. NPDC048506]|uniref:hypothetical protein n=1 Tax=Streptomyces sp. NPDC048506 TaxID=3155028 RepID=UPI00342810C7
MTDRSHFALRAALDLAGPDTADALAERLRPELLSALGDRFGLPEEMVEELLGGDAVQMRAALTIAPEEWLLGAAELGDPVVGRALWQAEYCDDSGRTHRAKQNVPDLLTTLLYAADLGDPRWYEDDGLFTLLYQEPAGPGLVPILTSGFPGLDVGALAVFAVHLPPPVVVDACLGLLEIWGGTEPFTRFLKLLDELPELDPGHEWLPDVLRRAVDAPDPEAFLREHRPAGEWDDPEHVRTLVELRYGDGPATKPDGLDWDLIRREHERLPVGGSSSGGGGWRCTGMQRLIRWEGCPTDLVMQSFHDDPYETAWHATELPFEALTGPGAGAIHLGNVLQRGMDEGWLPPHRVLSEVTPAKDVLRELPYDHEPTRKAVAELVAPLGTDPVNWLTCYDRMRRARGSVAELIADVTKPGSRKKRCTSWPEPRDAESPAGTSSRDPRAAFLALFRCASPEAQIAVVPHFDGLAVKQFLVAGNPSPRIRDAVVAAHGRPAQLAMAMGNPGQDTLEYLLDLDEPAVDARLLRNARLDGAERERLLAGRLRSGGTRPVPQELLAVLDDVIVSQDRDQLIAGLESGDLSVARRVVGRLQLHLPASCLRLLVALWERSGPEAVREILAMGRLPAALSRQAERELDVPDGLERLRARLTEEASPERLAAFVLRPGSRPEERLKWLLSEGMEPPWSVLLAAHRATPLSADLIAALVGHPDCPRELLLAWLTDVHRIVGYVLDEALERGALVPEDFLTHAAPAEGALGLVRRYAEDQPTEADWQRVRDRAAVLAREHLGTDVEAWAVCLQLLPTFVGTLSELAATAGAMTRVQG